MLNIPRIHNFCNKVISHAKPKAIKSALGNFLGFGVQGAKPLEKDVFCLINKTEKLPVSEYRRGPWGWKKPVNATSYSVVKIGKANDPEYVKEITSFYEGDEIVQRCVKENGVLKQMRIYENIGSSYSSYFQRNIMTKNYVMPRTAGKMSEKYKDPELANLAGMWKETNFEEQYVLTKFRNHKKAKKLLINKTEFDLANTGKIYAEVSEYPATQGIEPNTAKKVMGLRLQMVDGIPKITGKRQTPNTEFPLNDKFLAFRFLPPQEKQEALARYYIKEKGLDNLGINVTTNPLKVKNYAKAHFSSEDVEICFRYPIQDGTAPSTAAHEAEHAYQHMLMGRAGYDFSHYGKVCRHTMGKLKKQEEINEAFEYAKANIDYPELPDSYEFFDREKYNINYMEVMANKAGEKALDEYSVAQDFFLKQFSYPFPNNCF